MPHSETTSVDDRQTATGRCVCRREAGLWKPAVPVGDFDVHGCGVDDNAHGELRPRVQDGVGDQFIGRHHQGLDELAAAGGPDHLSQRAAQEPPRLRD